MNRCLIVLALIGSLNLDHANGQSSQQQAAFDRIGMLKYDGGLTTVPHLCPVYFLDGTKGVVRTECVETYGKGWMKFQDKNNGPQIHLHRANVLTQDSDGIYLSGVSVEIERMKKVEGGNVILLFLKNAITLNTPPENRENILGLNEGVYIFAYETCEAVGDLFYYASHKVTDKLRIHGVTLRGDTVVQCPGTNGNVPYAENADIIDHSGAIVLNRKYDWIGLVSDKDQVNACLEPKILPKEEIMDKISKMPAEDTTIVTNNWGIYQWYISNDADVTLPVLFITNRLGLIFTTRSLSPSIGISVFFHGMKRNRNEDYMEIKNEFTGRNQEKSIPEYMVTAIKMAQNAGDSNIELADPDITREATVYFTFRKTYCNIVQNSVYYKNDLLHISWDTVTFKSENEIYPYYIRDAPRYRKGMSVDISPTSAAIVTQNGKWVGFLKIDEFPRTTFYKSKDLFAKLRTENVL